MRDLLENIGADIAIYSPTYDLNRLNLEPRLIEILTDLKMKFTYNKSTAIIEVHGYGRFIFRSMDNPNKIIAYEVFRSHVDEIDTLPLAKALETWQKIIARNRQKVYVKGRIAKNRVSAYSTPEGYNFTYQMWGQGERKGYVYFRAATTSNPHLPDDYVERLTETYPANLVDAYIKGIWTNLTSGAVYCFDRNEHNTNVEHKRGEPVHLGMDFNVRNMNCTINVERGDFSYAVDEYTGLMDTPTMIEAIKRDYGDCSIVVYPDSSGKNTSSKSYTDSDISFLKKAGFAVRFKGKNPLVKDRVISVNNALQKGLWKVNIQKCPVLAQSLEQQIYDVRGQPEKNPANPIDDMNDAAGYYIFSKYPLQQRPKAMAW